MSCEDFMSMLDAYIDGELEAAQRARLLKHAEGCPDCAAALRQAEALQRLLAQLDAEPVVPLAAQAAWRGAVKRESRRKKLKVAYRAVGAVAAAFVVLVGATFVMRGTGLLNARRDSAVNAPLPGTEAPRLYYSQAREDAGPAAAGGAALEADGETFYLADAAEALPESAALEDRSADGAPLAAALQESESTPLADYDLDEANAAEPLLVRSAFREIYTDSFEAAHARVSDLAAEYGGYLVSDAVSGDAGRRSAEIVAAVPDVDLDAYLTALDYIGEVAQAELSTEDITVHYYDAGGRLEALTAERERLEALIAEAADADELTALSAQLEDVFDRIDALESDYRAYESRLNYAEVRILLREGAANAAVSGAQSDFGRRVRSGFSGTLQSLREFFADMAVSLAMLAPVAVIVLPVIALVWLIAAVLIRRRRRAREE